MVKLGSASSACEDSLFVELEGSFVGFDGNGNGSDGSSSFKSSWAVDLYINEV